MKKGLMILGGIFIAILILIASCAIPAVINGQGLDKESKAYADNIIQVIGASWDIAALEKQESPELANWETTNPNILKLLFTACQTKLGKMTLYKGSQGESNVSIYNGHETVTAKYIAIATFEKGSAKIKLTVIKHDNQWQIMGFYVELEALLR